MDILVHPVPPGSSFSLVARVLDYQEGILRCRGVSPEQDVCIAGAPELAPGLYTFYALERSNETYPNCLFGAQTEAHAHHVKVPFQGIKLIDFCSGMGGMSIGSQMLGLQTAVFVEKSPLACQTLRANFASPVIEGDISQVDTLKKVHPLIGSGHLQMTGGFPCQGFSRQGDQMGMEDLRSHSLNAILTAAWLFQVDEILLECVDTVLRFRDAMTCIEQFAVNANMNEYHLTLDLQDQWPARRNRFWCRLTRQGLPAIQIPRWPTSTKYSNLGSIMPLNAMWPDSDEENLAWDAAELAIYMDPCYGVDQRLLQSDGQAPTALHSWGHVTRACPCGCRQAFSLQRLLDGGARGFGLISSKHGGYRHLHPEEGAILCTVPPSFVFPMEPRAALTLLGQIAAPLQVLWMQAHALRSLQLHHWGQTNISPMHIIELLQHYLVTQAFMRWITPAMYQPRYVMLRMGGTDHIHYIKLDSPTTVHGLMQAEKQLAGWGHYAIVMANGQRLPQDVHLLPGIVYDIYICTSRQVRPFPSEGHLWGGGIALSGHMLGDRLLWTFMQLLTNSRDTEEQPDVPFLLYPFSAEHFLKSDIHPQVSASWQARRQHERGGIFAICEIHQHWVLLHGLWHAEQCGLHWILYDGLQQDHTMPIVSQVTQALSGELACQHLGLCVGRGILQTSPHTCGTLALVHMAKCLRLLDEVHHADVLALHDWLLSIQPPVFGLSAGGSDDCQRELANLLTTKGVPGALADDRAKQIIGKLGIRPVQTILKAKNPWAELKSMASKPGTMFRLVTHDEQQAYISERAKTKHGAKIPNAKAKKNQKGRAQDAQLHLHPDQFELNSSHFKDDSDLPVPQIHFDEVATEARGVALCDLDMATPFLENPKSISTDALALLILETKDSEVMQQAGLKSIIIPAKFKGTDEHTLLYGRILQLGDCPVTREMVGTDSCPDVVDTQVIKIQVYRDQLQADWSSFAGAPIRALVAAMESFQLCRGSNCGANCNKFHPAVDENIDNMIFELWARSFFDSNGHKIASDKATHFTVFMRVPEGALSKILTSSPHGVYIEPRGDKPREHDDRYRVIWLPGASYEEAMHLCRTYDRAICLVRMKLRYGIRVKKEDEQPAWSHLRPGIEYQAISVQHIYELFPIPHGTQKQAINKLLKDWEWPARPLHPGKGTFSHMAWRVGSEGPPPNPVMTGFNNDVVVTQIKEIKNQTPQPQLVASSKTHRHLRSATTNATSSKPSGDPWFESGKDPWTKYGPKPVLAQSGDGKHRLNELQEQLSKDITSHVTKGLQSQAQAAVQAAASSAMVNTEKQESRLQALEVGMQELKGQNAQFNSWFQQAGDRLKTTESTMAVMQQTLNSHQNEIHALGSTFQATMKNVKDDLSSEMNDSFNKQLSRLEALLEKKQRQS